MVAYLMQLLIVFLIWLILRLIQFIPWCAKYFSGKKNQQMAEDAKQMNLYKHAPIVKSILVDFQESQCYFVLSVQAAMLVAVSGDSSVLGATSVSQIWANFAQVVSMSGGYLPSLTFGLWLLRRSRLDSAYMLAWSLAAIIFTAFTIFSNIPHEPNVAGINPISNLGDLDKCGHNPPPLIYCSDEYYELYSLSRVFSAVCLMICGVMLLQKSSPYLEKSLSNYPAFSRISHAMKRVVKYRAFRVISKVWTPFAEMFLLSVNVFSITINIFQVGGDWSFGQIIAVTIWVPIFTKYIYWASCTS